MIARVLILVLLFGVETAYSESIKQETEGWCSPAVAGVHGNVTVQCHGVDPRALHRLNELLEKKDIELEQKVDEANKWARNYRELEILVDQLSKDSDLARRAGEALKEGRLEEAGDLLDRSLEFGEKQVAKIAAYHFSRAEIFGLQFKPLEALPHYARAYQYRPDEARYALRFGGALQEQGRRSEARSVYSKSIKKLQKAEDCGGARELVFMLTNLGVIFAEEKSFQPAQKAFEQALDAIQACEATIAADPGELSYHRANIRANIATIYVETGRLPEAEEEFVQALQLYAQGIGASYYNFTIKIASGLNNFGSLYYKANRLKDAEEMYKASLGHVSFLKEHFRAQPTVYLPLAARTLNNLGHVHAASKEYKRAEESYLESLCIYRYLLRTSRRYEPAAMTTLSNLNVLYRSTGREDLARRAQDEAKTLRDRPLGRSSPQDAAQLKCTSPN
jgi:Tfp pilus assembly protein PilF